MHCARLVLLQEVIVMMLFRTYMNPRREEMKWTAIAALAFAPMFLQSAAAQSCAGKPQRGVGGVKNSGVVLV